MANSERRRNYPEILNYIRKNGEDVISLKEYLLTKIDSQSNEWKILLEAQKVALTLAREGIDKRLDSMNEIREQLRSQKQEFITRPEHDALDKSVQELREFRSAVQAKASQSSVYIAYGLSIIGIIIALVRVIK